MAVININLKCDLQHPVKVQFLDGNLFSQDNQANRINVEVTDGGEPAEFSGTISANVIRQDGGTVAVTGGTISGNVASITLPEAAYAVVGMITVVIKLTYAEDVTTIAAIVANVYKSSTDAAVDPGTLIPSINSLITAINEAVESIPADYSNLSKAVSGLAQYEIPQTWVQGSINSSGADTQSQTRIRSGQYYSAANYSLVYIAPKDGFNFELYRYGENNAMIDHTGWVAVPRFVDLTTCKTFRIIIKKTAGGSIVPDEAADAITVTGIMLNDYAKFNSELPTGTDLNDLYMNGWYNTAGSGLYDNSPEGNTSIGQRLIGVLNCNKFPTANTYRIMVYYNNTTGVSAIRWFVSGYWRAWHIRSKVKMENNVLESFTAAEMAFQGYNTGERIRIMSYNAAVYKNGTENYIPDEKILNFRKMLGKLDPDIIGLQEDTDQIDENEKTATKYLFRPNIPIGYGVSIGGNTVRSKIRGGTEGRVKFTQYGSKTRGMKYVVFTIGSKQLIVAASHPTWNDAGDGGTSAANIAIRASQYQEIFKWLNGEITLPDYSDNSAVTVPEHTHAIVCMDANSITASDKSNLVSLASANNFIVGNGGRMGWFITNFKDQAALDNIIVSDNIIINNIEAWSSMYDELYSDHVPLLADVTLI